MHHATGRAGVFASDGLHAAPHWRRVDDFDLRQLSGPDFPRHRYSRQQRHAEPFFDHLLGRLDVVQLHHGVRHDPTAQKQRLRQLEVARRAVEHDQPLATHFGKLHRATA